MNYEFLSRSKRGRDLHESIVVDLALDWKFRNRNSAFRANIVGGVFNPDSRQPGSGLKKSSHSECIVPHHHIERDEIGNADLKISKCLIKCQLML